MMAPFVLLALGFLLIFIEFYLPGIVIGAIGGVFVIVSLFLFAAQTSASWAVLLYLVAVIVALGYLIKFAMWRIRTAKPEYSVYSNDSQEGFIASKYDKNAIGKRGEVVSDLKPGGYITVDGIQHQALSEEGYITRGTAIEVIGGQEESLIVRKSA